MMRQMARLLAVAVPIATVSGLVDASPASAHERRAVGAFQLVVGWGDEPSYTGFKNSVQVTITEAATGAPVTDISDSLAVEVIKGADKTKLPLEANFRVGAFGTPGDYRAWLTPTRPGTYTFHFTGTIRGQAVDASFTSSNTTFDDVDDVANSEFPAKDPSTGQLATRLDREVPRLDAAARQAKDQAAGARTLALIGVVVGALGLLAAAGMVVVVRRNGRDGGIGDGRRGTPPERSGAEAESKSAAR